MQKPYFELPLEITRHILIYYVNEHKHIISFR